MNWPGEFLALLPSDLVEFELARNCEEIGKFLTEKLLGSEIVAISNKREINIIHTRLIIGKCFPST